MKRYFIHENKNLLAVTRTPPLDKHAWVTSSNTPSFDEFDYLDYWYPVAFARDLTLDQLTKVTLFDEDYVVSRLSKRDRKKKKKKLGVKNNFKVHDGDEVIALLDKCPHKLAALSEGRVTSCGEIQCAYHGWIFDGGSGKCLEVPQILSGDISYEDRGGNNSPISMSKMGHAVSVPAMISQGMVWIFPGGMERALLAPEPPRVPEIDLEGFLVNPFVRDFPVDWTLLIENIMDPDHGLFAHTMPAFDLYSASTTKAQELVEEVRNDGSGWRVTSKVDAVEKLVSVNNRWKKEVRKKEKGKENVGSSIASSNLKSSVIRQSTTTFVAPNLIYMGRRDPETKETSFVTAFWICPVGLGRSRFMSASVGKLPFNIPRWLLNINLNNFLDQDTFLIYSQQKHVLSREAENYQMEGKSNQNLRKGLFVYRSPSEKLQSRIATFFDTTLKLSPNRMKKFNYISGLFNKEREFVLDRFSQHTKICPDSMSTLKKCVRIRRGSVIISFLIVLCHLSRSTCNPLLKFINKGNRVKIILLFTTVASVLSKIVEKEFHFKYNDEFRKKDVQKIPSVWLDKRYS